jgi:hypothetical protein
MRKDEKVNTAEQFPFLLKIPLLVFLFRSASNKVDKTELLVMITPHIINGNELTTGNERGFGEKPGKDYRDYRGIGMESQTQNKEENNSPDSVAQDVPGGVSPKSYRYLNLDSKKIDNNKESPAPQVKDMNYEPLIKANSVAPADVTIKGQKP